MTKVKSKIKDQKLLIYVCMWERRDVGVWKDREVHQWKWIGVHFAVGGGTMM